MFTSIIITDPASGKKVICTIADAELYKSGYWTFDALWDIYGEDSKFLNGFCEYEEIGA